MSNAPACDRFGNPHAPGLPYARGEIIASTADDLAKLRTAWNAMAERWAEHGPDAVLQMSGLERSLRIEPGDLALMDDDLAPARFGERLRDLALEHLGGDPARHDVALMNRQTAALLAAADVMVPEGGTVIGVSPSYSHPAVVRAVRHARAEFVDVRGAAGLRRALDERGGCDVIMLTRLAVTYDLLPGADLEATVALAREAGARIVADDAGGARVGPAAFGQPRALELGVDVASTGLDKYGTAGPRLGLLGGERETVARIRVRAFEMGLEARPMLHPAVVRSLEGYRPERVRELIASTRAVAAALRQRLGAARVTENEVIARLEAEDVLEMALERAGLDAAPVVPYEATAALAMLMLREHGIFTVHFAGIPPGTAALLVKFLAPELVERLGGPDRFAEAVDRSLDSLAGLLREPGAVRRLLLADP